MEYVCERQVMKGKRMVSVFNQMKELEFDVCVCTKIDETEEWRKE